MNEKGWFKEAKVSRLLRELEMRGTTRKLRLLGCACCRGWKALLRAKEVSYAVEVAEKVADGIVPLDSFLKHFWSTPVDFVTDLVQKDAHTSVMAVARFVRWKFGRGALSRVRSMIYDIFGNPFHPARLDPAWLTPTVVAIAHEAYVDRVGASGQLKREHLYPLSDVLEDAGCTDADILNHLRSNGPHVRGCWVIDLVLGRS